MEDFDISGHGALTSATSFWMAMDTYSFSAQAVQNQVDDEIRALCVKISTKLPRELRDIVWEYRAFKERCVHIEARRQNLMTWTLYPQIMDDETRNEQATFVSYLRPESALEYAQAFYKINKFIVFDAHIFEEFRNTDLIFYDIAPPLLPIDLIRKIIVELRVDLFEQKERIIYNSERNSRQRPLPALLRGLVKSLGSLKNTGAGKLDLKVEIHVNLDTSMLMIERVLTGVTVVIGQMENTGIRPRFRFTGHNVSQGHLATLVRPRSIWKYLKSEDPRWFVEIQAIQEHFEKDREKYESG